MNALISKAGVLALLIFAGCASPQGKFQVNKDPSYDGKLKRVLIVSLNEDLASHLGRDFSNRLLTRFTMLLTQKGVSSEIVHLNQKDLDRTASVRSAVARFKPDQLFYVAVTRVLSRNGVQRRRSNDLPQFTSEMSISFEFNLTETQSGKTVWRGELHFYTVPYPEDVADQLVKQLGTERFF